MSERYLDGQGMAFEEYRLWVPPRIDWWPHPPRVEIDKAKAQSRFHFDFRGRGCWWCGLVNKTSGDHELHHLFAGSRGRSHERFLFTWLCRNCHYLHDGPDDLPYLLYLKWKHDQENTNWVKMAIRRGMFLPDLETKPRRETGECS